MSPSCLRMRACCSTLCVYSSAVNAYKTCPLLSLSRTALSDRLCAESDISSQQWCISLDFKKRKNVVCADGPPYSTTTNRYTQKPVQGIHFLYNHKATVSISISFRVLVSVSVSAFCDDRLWHTCHSPTLHFKRLLIWTRLKGCL
jgi:hypothetical protein